MSSKFCHFFRHFFGRDFHLLIITSSTRSRSALAPATPLATRGGGGGLARCRRVLELGLTDARMRPCDLPVSAAEY